MKIILLLGMFLAYGARCWGQGMTQEMDLPGEDLRNVPAQDIGIVLPSRVDTRWFSPQIAPNLKADHRFRFHKNQREEPKTPYSDLPMGTVDESLIRGVRGAQFPGIDFDYWSPPDPSLGVGPSHVVQVVNSEVAFFQKNGQLLFSQPLFDFFSVLSPANSPFDPKVIYDHVAERFIIVALVKADSPRVSQVIIAVSDDSNPNGSWYRYFFNTKLTEAGVDYWFDYPGMGFNKDAILFSGNMFGWSDPYHTTQFLSVQKSGILSGSGAVFHRWYSNLGFSTQVAHTMSSTQSTMYGAARSGTSLLRLFAFRNLTSTPTMSLFSISTPTVSNPTRDAESTNGKVLDTIGGRIYNAYNRGNRVLVAHNAERNGRIVSAWYSVAPNGYPDSGFSPTYVQGGFIENANYDYHMPAIASNAYGDIAMVFTRSNTSRTADKMIVSRKDSDPDGVMGAPQIFDTSDGNAPISSRWGDYFSISVDPVDDTTFWCNAMLVRDDNRWKTEISQFEVTRPMIDTIIGPTTIRGGQVGKFTIQLERASPLQPVQIELAATSTGAFKLSADSVQIPAGTRTASINVRLGAVNRPTTFRLFAYGPADSHAKTVTVLP